MVEDREENVNHECVALMAKGTLCSSCRAELGTINANTNTNTRMLCITTHSLVCAKCYQIFDEIFDDINVRITKKPKQ